MWELDDWIWLNRVHELLSRDNTIIHDDLDFLNKGERPPRKKKECPIPCPKVDNHRTPGSEITGIKLIIKNLGKNPVVICTQKSVFKNPNAEEAPGTSTPSLKNLGRDLKRRSDCEEEQCTTVKKNLNLLSRNVIPESPSPELPQALKNHILETGGCLDNVVLVIQKELFESDLSKNLNRLSIPYSKVNTQFLNSNEVECLDTPKAGIQATLIEPCLEECVISLRNWKSNSMFALVSSWNEVCRRNQLRRGNTIRLWSFRRNSELCFGLLVIN